ncbi:MAG: M28 family peptidase, partial [Dysgonamonadaceae bacterium]|nr:M28 family peptidase [Dysgonamonadaceae bacterium]
MRKFFLLAFIAIAFAAKGQNTLVERLQKHVSVLADDSLRGRKAGSADSRKTADYIIEQWQEIGIEPFFKADSGKTYFQHFNGKYLNLVGILEGDNPALKDEYIVIGAHYDHLGYKVNSAGDTVVYNGADDNAS